LLCWLGVHCGIYKSSYNTSNRSHLNSTILLYPSHPGTVSTGLIFPFTYMCTRCLHHVHLPCLFPTSFPSHWDHPPPKAGPALRFCKGKKVVFLFV
jgi:hypothetical protein